MYESESKQDIVGGSKNNNIHRNLLDPEGQKVLATRAVLDLPTQAYTQERV